MRLTDFGQKFLGRRLAGFLLLPCAALLMMAMHGAARADRAFYTGVVDLTVDRGAFRAEHHHDWRTGDSYLKLRDIATDAELFRRPAPALTHIWISNDSKYVVGVSTIKAGNPYQLVVFSRSGGRLLQRNVVAMKLPGAVETVVNHIYWYRTPVQMTIVENGLIAILSIENAVGGVHQFRFLATHYRRGSPR